MIEFLAGMLLAGVPGIILVFRIRRTKPGHTDYKERWLQAVALLGQEGRLTDEQVASLQGRTPPPVTPAPAPVQAPEVTQATLRSMTSGDRATLEIQRAIRGMGPGDDLEGMTSGDKKRVIEMRMRYRRT